MKFAVLLAALLPTLASAEPAFWCGSDNSDISVSFSSPATHASVQVGKNDALEVVADLACVGTDANQRRDRAYMVCSSSGSGYTVALNQAHGPIEAVVTQTGHDATLLSCGRN